jgi:glycosyltransferase involved in cell wall biosynthesis
MKILIITQFFPPEPGRLLLEAAQWMRDAGHQVAVLTGFPNYPMGRLYPGYKMRLWQRETLEGIPVIRMPLYPEHSRSAWRRALNYTSFAISAAILGPWLVPEFDVIHFYHPPLTSAFPAWLLGRVFRKPVTCEIQDMWPETLAATGMCTRPWVLKTVGKIAKAVYGEVKAIRVISPGFGENLVRKGVPREKIRVISNWVNTDFYSPRTPDEELAKKLGLANHFNVMFAGTIGLAQGLETVLNAAALLADLDTVQFVLVGDGADSDRLQKLALQRGLSNVKFLGRYPGERMPALYALADVLMLHLNDDELFRITIPHKLFTYLASGKPILAALEGDAGDVVTSAEAGLVCRSSDPQAMADAVRRLFAMGPGELQAMGNRGRQAACLQYSRNVLIEKFVAMLQSATISRPYLP